MTQQQEPFSCNTDAPCADCIPAQPHADRQGQPESCVEPSVLLPLPCTYMPGKYVGGCQESLFNI